jgi:fructose-1,6-bisphosphatase/inositol monophosphatase family enzyme
MTLINTKEYKIYSNFLSNLANDLTKFYFSKLNKTFKVTNKIQGKGYDPVTTSDKAFEKFIRAKIKNKFPNHQVIGEEFGHKKTLSDYTWVIDPIDGTRSFVIGNPTWSNLISLNFKGNPIVGLANFPILNKYYLNINNKNAYVFENKRKRKISVSKNIPFSKIKVSGAFHGAISLKVNAISNCRCFKLFSFM